MSGRTKDFRLTHFAVDPENAPRPGDAVTSLITQASPNFILAEGLPTNTRKTRGGDAQEARVKEMGPQPIMVGMPTLAKLKENMAK
jgi:tRNA-2-methylthio-N6-dimethylallyladenosine synthase